MAGIVRTDWDRLGRGAARSPRLQSSLGTDRRGDPSRPAITDQPAAPIRCRFVFCPRHLFTPSQPSDGPPARRGRIPARLARLGRCHRAGGVTPVVKAAGPAVKTSSPRLPPRNAQRAVGGIRAWGENPGRRASSLTTVLPFGCSRARTSKSLRGPSPRRSAHIAASRRRPLLAFSLSTAQPSGRRSLHRRASVAVATLPARPGGTSWSESSAQQVRLAGCMQCGHGDTGARVVSFGYAVSVAYDGSRASALGAWWRRETTGRGQGLDSARSCA